MCCGKHINKMGWKEKRAFVKVLQKVRLSPQRADKENRKNSGLNSLPQQETIQPETLDLKAGSLKGPILHFGILFTSTEYLSCFGYWVVHYV